MGLGYRIYNRLKRCVERISDAFAMLAVLCLMLLVGMVCYGVSVRYVLNRPQNWTEELAGYCLAGVALFGLAHALARDAHIRVEILKDRLPARFVVWLEAAVHLVGIAFCTLFVLASWSTVDTYFRRDTHSIGSLEIPLWIPSCIMLLGTSLFLAMMLLRFARAVAALRLGRRRATNPLHPGGKE